MKKAILLSTVFMLIGTSSGYADGGIQGKWKMTGQQCKSGAIPSNAVKNEGINIKTDVEAEIDSSTISTVFNIDVMYDKQYVDTTRAQVLSSRAQIASSPNYPTQSEDLAKIDASLKAMASWEKGFKCASKIQLAYVINGQTITISKTVSQSSNCPGSSSVSSNPSDAATFELTGDTLRLSPVKPDQAGLICPKGDYPITVMSRIR